jgi:hypothetical protein
MATGTIRRAARKESPSSSFRAKEANRRTFSFLGRERNLLAFWPNRRGSTLVLEPTKLAPDGGAHAQL